MAQSPFGGNDSYTKVLGAKTRIAGLLALLTLGCAGPKEAADPHEMLAEEYERAGAEEEAPEGPPDPQLEPASRAQCEAATRRVFALGGVEQPDAATLGARVDECLARGTSRREAECVSKAADAAAVDRCAE